MLNEPEKCNYNPNSALIAKIRKRFSSAMHAINADFIHEKRHIGNIFTTSFMYVYIYIFLLFYLPRLIYIYIFTYYIHHFFYICIYIFRKPTFLTLKLVFIYAFLIFILNKVYPDRSELYLSDEFIIIKKKLFQSKVMMIKLLKITEIVTLPKIA